VAIPRHDDVVVATPATDVERKGEMGVRVEQRPRVDADRICCRVALDVAGIATLRRKIAAEATMVPMNFYFFLPVSVSDLAPFVSGVCPWWWCVHDGVNIWSSVRRPSPGGVHVSFMR
jgi:hypothetical protein